MQVANAFPSLDGITTKYVLDAGDALVECTHVDRTEKHILCFSTAVGCSVGCGFCAATSFRRRLTAVEMVDQVLSVAEKAIPTHSTKPVLFSAMGEGEPLLSMPAGHALIDAFERLLATRSESRVALSTTAIKPSVVRWLATAAPPQLKLQISLHAPTDVQRRVIIPHAAPLAEVVSAGRAFADARPGRLEWNYVLIEGLNDSEEDALQLTKLLRSGDAVKLNRLNPVPSLPWSPSKRSVAFARTLRNFGLEPEHYCTDGVDIAAACGQLKSQVAQERRRRSSPRTELVVLT
jgi:23S rRNA (adenine2503-C2)-methyltransferase